MRDEEGRTRTRPMKCRATPRVVRSCPLVPATTLGGFDGGQGGEAIHSIRGRQRGA